MASILSYVKVYFCLHEPFYHRAVNIHFQQLAIHRSAFLCIRLPFQLHAHRIRSYFNVENMAFIICIIGPGVIGLICKIHFIHGYMMHLKGNLMLTHNQQVQYSSVIVVLAMSIQVPIIILPALKKACLLHVRVL